MKLFFTFLSFVVICESCRYAWYDAHPQPKLIQANSSDIERVAKAYKIPLGLFEALIAQESGGNSSATRYEPAIASKYKVKDPMLATSIGLTQVIPLFHSKTCGLAHWSELFERGRNLECGAKVLKACLNRTQEWAQALTCYNGSSVYSNSVLLRYARKSLSRDYETLAAARIQ